MYSVRFDRFGIIVMRNERDNVSLYLISVWRLFVVAISPRGRWIDLVLCDRRRPLPRTTTRTERKVSQ